MKVVFDTNVYVSALVFPGGAPDLLLQAARLGDCQLHISPDILSELRRVLELKFRFMASEVDALFADLVRTAVMCYPTERLQCITRIDADNRILECAVAAQANYLVSGDRRDLLPLETIGATLIVTPRTFLDLLTAHR